MWFCENVTLRGYTIRNSANWAHAIQNSKGITIREVTVLGGHDGFDVRTCDDILVEDCCFRTGDDCIAGFDNCNVTVRNCYFESSCSVFRFGGTDVLVENCRSGAATYGFRGRLSKEEKENRMPTGENQIRTSHYAFLYYCDNRANVRKTPGNILIRNCQFASLDAIVGLPFGHMWCCNRSLRDITFENCVFDGLCYPMQLICPEEEPLTLRLRECTVIARKGFEQIAFLTGKNVAAVETERVSFINMENPSVTVEKGPINGQ